MTMKMKKSYDRFSWALLALLFQILSKASCCNAQAEIVIKDSSDPIPPEDMPADVVEEESEFMGEEGDEEDFTVLWIVISIPIVLVLFLIIYGGHTKPPVDITGRPIKHESLSFHEVFGPKGWNRFWNVCRRGMPDPQDYEPIPDALPKPGKTEIV